MPSKIRSLRPLRESALPRLAILVVSLYAVVALCLATLPHGAPINSVRALAVPFDLMVSVPALAYFLVLRRHKISPLFVLPLVWAGGAISTLIAPAEERAFLSVLLALAVVLDAAVIVCEGRRALQAYRRARATSTDPAEWFAPALQELLPSKRIAHLGGMETATLYYAVASWRAKPDCPKGARAFTCHRKSGYGAMVGGLMLALPVEVLGMHLLISRFSPVAASIVTALSIYSVLLLVGDWRATMLRPVLVSSDWLTVRFGVRYTIRIPLNAVAGLSHAAPNLPKEETMNLAVMGSDPLWITLSRPIETATLSGAMRSVSAIGLSADDPAGLINAIDTTRADGIDLPR